MTPDQLLAAAIRGLTPPPPPPEVDLYHVAPIRVSVREAADALLVALDGLEPRSFRSLVAGIDDRIEVIVRFLAVLELYKQGVVEVDQVETFGDLTVRRLELGETTLDLTSMEDWERAPSETDDAKPAEETEDALSAEHHEIDLTVGETVLR